MVVTNQDHPGIDRLEVSVALSGPTVDHLGSRFCFAERISARIHRISDHVPDRVVYRQLPNDAVSGSLHNQCRQARLLCAKPQQHLPGASQLRQFCEYQMHSLLYAPVWINLYFAVLRPSESHWQSELQFASARLLANCLQRTLP